jgi:hypothetical protein
MKNKFNFGVSMVLITTFFVVGCDWLNDVAVVKNNSNKPIFIIYTLGKVLTDSSVSSYYKTLKEFVIEPDSSKKIATANRVLKKEPDSSKIYLYIFYVDSLNKYERLSHYKGILKQSLIKSIEIQLNKTKEPIDTIHVR